MQKVITYKIVILVIGLSIATLLLYIKNEVKSGIINFQLYGSYEVDTKNISKLLAIEEHLPITFFYQVYDVNDLQGGLAEGLGLEFLNFDNHDYQNKYLVITIGRELMEIRYKYRKGYDTPVAKITLAEEYHDKIMYIYMMDKILLWPSDLTGYNSFYIMNRSQKIYYGIDIQSLNYRLHNEDKGK